MTERPSWGVLVKAPLRRVASYLRATRPDYEVEGLGFREHGDWTAAFYMKPAPTSETDAAEDLRTAGYDAIHLDFDRDRYRVHRWDGESWTWTGESPVVVCAEVGIQVPGHEMPTLPAHPFRPQRVRAISLVVGATAEEVESALGEREFPDTIEQGSRGVLVTKHPLWPDEPTYGDLSERLPDRVVYHVEYDPEDGRFVCLSLHDGVVQSIFEIGNSWIRKNAPIVDSVAGEATAHGVVEKLGIPAAFLAARRDGGQ